MKFYTNVSVKGNDILLRGYENGRRVQSKVNYQPFCFRVTKNPKAPYRTIDNRPAEKIDFHSIGDMQDFISTYQDVGNMELLGMTARNSLIYPFLHEYYPGEIQYDATQIRIAFLDIEVAADEGFPNIEQADKPLTAITIKVGNNYYTFGCGDYTPTNDTIHYAKCKDERDLIMKFLTLWDSPLVDADIITGWNVEAFDMPYLVNRITRVFGDGGKMAKKLSPWRIVEDRDIPSRVSDRVTKAKTIRGCTILDYLSLYRKFTYSDTESYSLNHIAHIELGEKKIDYSEFERLYDLYRHDFQKFIEYNIHDVTLVSKIDDKMKLIDQVLAITYDAKVDYIDTLKTVRMWDMIIHNYLIDRNIVVPLSKNGEVEKDEPIQGAYVKDPKPGMYKYIVSFDFTSLYPLLIMQYNISPDTKVGKVDLSPEDCLLANNRAFKMARDDASLRELTLCANGTMYRKDKVGFLSALMEKVFADRKKYKKLMLEAKQKYEISKDPEDEKKYVQYNNMQLAKKIQLNSCYGALSNIYFRFFDTDLAEAITLSGQVSIRWTQDRVNEFLNQTLNTKNADYVIAADTDSLYITLDAFVDKVYGGNVPEREKVLRMLDKACEQVLQPVIDKSCDDLGKHMLVYGQRMQMKRESIADKGIWMAKKRYILNVFNEEGVQYDKPKLKMKGIEAVKSSTPAVIKEAIKNALYIIMNGTKDEFEQYCDDFRQKFEDMPFEDVAFPRSCQGVSKHTLGGKRIPIHVRGALVYNSQINKHKIDKKHSKIQDGDKVKFCYLRLPNPLQTNVISSPGALPKQFNIDKYIDHDKQFDKSFMEPMKAITDHINWRVGKQLSLEDIFG